MIFFNGSYQSSVMMMKSRSRWYVSLDNVSNMLFLYTLPQSMSDDFYDTFFFFFHLKRYWIFETCITISFVNLCSYKVWKKWCQVVQLPPHKYSIIWYAQTKASFYLHKGIPVSQKKTTCPCPHPLSFHYSWGYHP